jgi:isopenicillin N synthase-like dioxygenase
MPDCDKLASRFLSISLTGIILVLDSTLVKGFIYLTMAVNFSEIPVVDYALSKSPDTIPQFSAQLRDALVKVGFFYLENHPIPPSLQSDLKDQSRQLFDLSLEKKNKMGMKINKHFVGYVGMDESTTSNHKDYRESYTVCRFSLHFHQFYTDSDGPARV